MAKNVFSVYGLTPEQTAHAIGKYSRSAASLQEIVKDVTSEGAAKFLQKFAVDYGHASLRDLAHLALCIEGESILAAIEIENESLWDGQERSTRYQADFGNSRNYIVPPEIDPENDYYSSVMAFAFDSYNSLTSKLNTILRFWNSKPEGITQKAYESKIYARALDVSRSLLRYATETNVGQVTSARTLEKQVRRLKESPYAEMRNIALQMQVACQENNTALPTLLKHVEPSNYHRKMEADMRQIVGQYVGNIIPDTSFEVQLVEPDIPLVEAVSTILYRYSNLSYRQIQSVVREMPHYRLEGIYSLAFKHRGTHDEWPTELRSGYSRIFDVCLDGKSMQDLFRHRNMVQIRQDLTTEMGFINANKWFERGLAPDIVEAANVEGLLSGYANTLGLAKTEVNNVQNMFGPYASHYVIPVGYRRRALFKMHDAQLAYLIETRSQPQAHFECRWAANEMWNQLCSVDRVVAANIRCVPFTEQNIFQR